MNFITRKHLNRRTFLRGIGSSLALPMLDSMVPALAETTSGAKAAPVRMAFVYTPNGIIPAAWTPKSDGREWEFMRAMKPLEVFREHINVLTGLAQINQNYDACIEDVRSKVSWDLRYIRDQGMWMDCKILLQTVPSVLLKYRGW